MADSESQSQGLPEWKKCHEGMVNKMMAEKLKEAVRMRDRGMLERSMEDCKACGFPDDNPDMKTARRTLKVMDIKDSLQKAVAAKDIQEIDQQVEAIVNGPYHKYLQLEVANAEHMAELYERHNGQQDTGILDMDKRAMSELRRYAYPPVAVKDVMRASLLLLGEDESTTEEWHRSIKYLNPDGPTGLNRRIMRFEASGVHPEIAARAQQILSHYELRTVRSVSAATGTFYVWAMGVVDECLSKNTDSDQPVQPASSERQREILGRPPLVTSHAEQARKYKYGSKRRMWRPQEQQDGAATQRQQAEEGRTSRSDEEKPAWKT